VQDRGVPVGSLLTIELSNAKQSFNRRFIVRVVHVAPQGDSHRVGAAFMRHLKPEELRAILTGK
jgi:hypothetical protein